MWSASVGRAAAGALWMRAYFKGPGMLHFDFMRRGRWHQAAAKSFIEVCALLDGFRHAAIACVLTQTWYLFEVCTPRGEKRKTDWVGCQWNERGCHQTALLSDSFLYWLSTHTFSVFAELKSCSGSFVFMKSMSCSLSCAVNFTFLRAPPCNSLLFVKQSTGTEMKVILKQEPHLWVIRGDKGKL